MTSALECRASHLRPGGILDRLAASPVVFLPVGPLEWHGPHLPLGVDPLNAEHVALAVCREIGGVVWPTLYAGTERERSPETLRHLGFSEHEWIVGMDFPANTLQSAYYDEEIFALVLRHTLLQIARWPAKLAVIVNGHGAVNHQAVLRRLEAEFNHNGPIAVRVRMAMPSEALADGSISHAGGDETSLMLHIAPGSVDLNALPPLPAPLRYADCAIVDGKGFDGHGRPDRCVEDDPRTTATAERGRSLFNHTVREIVDEVRDLARSQRNGTA